MNAAPAPWRRGLFCAAPGVRNAIIPDFKITGDHSVETYPSW